MEGNSLAVEGVAKSGLSGFESTILSILHVADELLHVGKSFLNAGFEFGLFFCDQKLEFVASVVVSVNEFLLELVDSVPGIFAECVHFLDELFNGFVD